VFCPQPYLKISQGAVPTEYLDDHGEDEAGDVKNHYRLLFPAEDRTEYQKRYPGKVDKDDCVGHQFVEHTGLLHIEGILGIPKQKGI
jgi:hypothetical protein